METTIKKMIEGLKTSKQVINALTKHNIKFEDCTEEKGYFDIKIWTSKNECLRIYKPYKRKEFAVQKMARVEFKYSGIPVFEPSGVRSF